MSHITRIIDLTQANLIIGSSEEEEVKVAAMQVIKRAATNEALLVAFLTQEHVTVTQAFMAVVQADPSSFEGVSPEHPKKVHIIGQYLGEDHFYIETEFGNARVDRIEFFGELRIEETKTPVVRTVEYRHVETGEVISQLAAFAPHSILGMNLALELHRMGDEGETHVIMRRLPDD